MRRQLSLLLILLIIFSICGCAKEKEIFQQPVNVYYCRDEIAYNTNDGVFVAEAREFSGYDGNLRGFLNAYLQGPNTEGMVSPFPEGGWILELKQVESQMHVRLSVHFSMLSGRDQTLASACISKTILEITDCESVVLSIDSMPENEDVVIIMNNENILLMDTTNIS